MLDIYIGTFILLMLAALVILWPAVKGARRKTDNESVSQKALNIAVYKDRLAELESDLSQKLITKDQFEVLKTELETSLLIDVDSTDVVSAASVHSKVPSLVVVVILALLPAITWGLYWKWGAYNALSDARMQESFVSEKDMPQGDIEQLLLTLEQRLKEDPNNVDGWILLGRSYMNMGRYGDAIPTLHKVAELFAARGEDNSAVYGMIGQAMYFDQKGMTPEVLAFVKSTLEKNPNEVNSLGLMGMFSYEQGQYQQAIKHWENILNLVPDHPSREAIEAGIADARHQLSASGIAMDNAQVTDSETTMSSNAGITIAVAIDESILTNSQPTDTLFVYARAANGPKMPLAIVRKQVKDLPVTVTLDDSMAMGPMAKLSSVDEVEIIARVSKSGTPAPNAGDLEGSLGPVQTSGQTDTIHILIDKVLN